MIRTRCEERQAEIGNVAPAACISSHKAVQLAVACVRLYWPPDVGGTLSGVANRIAPRSAITSGMYPRCTTVGVGQKEHTPAEVRRTDFTRCEHACRNLKAQALKVSADVGEAQIEVAFDVFAEDPFGSGFVDDAADVRPEVPGIGDATSFAGGAERLAWIAGRDEMNAAAPRAAVEGGKVAPDSSLTQGRVCHPRHESGRSMSFPLDVTYSSIGGFGDMDAEIEPGVAGA